MPLQDWALFSAGTEDTEPNAGGGTGWSLAGLLPSIPDVDVSGIVESAQTTAATAGQSLATGALVSKIPLRGTLWNYDAEGFELTRNGQIAALAVAGFVAWRMIK